MPNELASAQVNAPAAAAPAQAAPEIPSPFADVVAGQIPAVSLPPIDGDQMDGAQQYVSQNLDTLLKAGLDYHETKDQVTILFNPKIVKLADIEKAEKNGTLDKIAVPAAAAAPADAEAPADAGPDASGAAAAAAGPQDAPGALAGAVAAPPPNAAMQAARLKNQKAPAINTPNPVANQLAKRSV